MVRKGTITMAAVINPLSFKLCTVRPCHFAHSISHANEPRTGVDATIDPSVASFPRSLVIIPLADVFGVSWPLHSALTMPFVVFEGTIIFDSTFIEHQAMTLAFIIFPFARIHLVVFIG